MHLPDAPADIPDVGGDFSGHESGVGHIFIDFLNALRGLLQVGHDLEAGGRLLFHCRRDDGDDFIHFTDNFGNLADFMDRIAGGGLNRLDFTPDFSRGLGRLPASKIGRASCRERV